MCIPQTQTDVGTQPLDLHQTVPQGWLQGVPVFRLLSYSYRRLGKAKGAFSTPGVGCSVQHCPFAPAASGTAQHRASDSQRTGSSAPVKRWPWLSLVCSASRAGANSPWAVSAPQQQGLSSGCTHRAVKGRGQEAMSTKETTDVQRIQWAFMGT